MNDLERKLLDSPTLPTLPAVAQRVLELLRDEDADLRQLAEVIACDPSLTAKMLRLINSSLYGMSREIVSLREAVLYLGMNAVRSVALSFSFLAGMRPLGPNVPELVDLWRLSLMNALASRRLATEAGGWDPEEAFLAGLVADCGVLLLYKALPEYPGILRRFYEGEADLLDLERGSVDTDHMHLGAALLKRWEFPEHFRSVVAAHHDPSLRSPGSREEHRARILTAAWLCARALRTPGFAIEVPDLDQHASTLLGLPVAVARAAIAELPDELSEAASLFEIPAGEPRSYEVILQEANEALSELAVEASSMATPPEGLAEGDPAGFAHVRRQLAGTLEEDEAAGLLVRASFDTLLEAFHRRARQARTPLGVMLIEIIDLKEIESREGEAGVNATLAELARRISSRMRGTDQFARFAWDQIAALAPSCGSADLKHAAERVRLRAESEPLETPCGSWPCQVAIGLASATPHRDGIDSRALVSLASAALDRANTSPERIALGS